MKTFFLALWLLWQNITAPLYPDPAVEVAKSASFLKAHLVVGARLTPEVISGLHSRGFEVRELDPGDQQTLRREKPWSELPKARILRCSKSIRGRPAITVTDVTAWLALGAKDVILHNEVAVLRTGL